MRIITDITNIDKILVILRLVNGLRLFEQYLILGLTNSELGQ